MKYISHVKLGVSFSSCDIFAGNMSYCLMKAKTWMCCRKIHTRFSHVDVLFDSSDTQKYKYIWLKLLLPIYRQYTTNKNRNKNSYPSVFQKRIFTWSLFLQLSSQQSTVKTCISIPSMIETTHLLNRVLQVKTRD